MPEGLLLALPQGPPALLGAKAAQLVQGRGAGGPAWWEVLGVSPAASAEQVRAAYRRLALRHHPDRGGDEHVFKQVQAAFDQVRKLRRA